MTYKYFVSFASNGRHGMCEITTKKPIETYESLDKVTRTIEKDRNVESVVILNWKELKA